MTWLDCHDGYVFRWGDNGNIDRLARRTLNSEPITGRTIDRWKADWLAMLGAPRSEPATSR